MAKQSPVVSIIVPVYNAGRSLRRCLDSLVGQTWRSIEVVVVNDGSADDSLSIAESYAGIDGRVTVLSQDNQGVSTARNLGIENCSGDYITFVDADDFIEATMVEELMALAQGRLAPLVFCYNDELWQHVVEERHLFQCVGRDSLITAQMVTREIIHGRAGLVCGKLFKAEVVRDRCIRFDKETRMCEDQLFFTQVARYCDEFLVVRKPLYHYDRRNEQSTTRAWLPEAFEMHLRAHRKMSRLLADAGFRTEFADDMEVRLKNVTSYCFMNEASERSPFRGASKVRRIREILRNGEVKNAFAVAPAERLSDKIERCLVTRRMATALFVFCWVRAGRIRFRRTRK